MKILNHFLLSAIITISLFNLLGCGGGGGKNNGNTVGLSTGNTNNNISWTANTFENENQFKDACATPRTGTDINGRTFLDTQGSTLQENHWLRSWSNNTYLWYDEITDQNPADFSSTTDYFKQLKTFETTASGNKKDHYSFTYDSEAWQYLNQSGQSTGYGAEFIRISGSPPRKILIAYTEPNSPATSNFVNLIRGTEILTVDGADVINSSDIQTLNAGLFPSNSGETHTFTVLDLGASQSRQITMTSETITSPPVKHLTIFSTDTGNVGYILFNSHNKVAEQELFNTVTQLSNANVTDLVLDLRYNGGGLLAIASQLSYMIAGNAASNKVFYNTIFNDKHTVLNPVTKNILSPTPFYNQSLGLTVTAGRDLPSLNLNKVYILTTKNTCSASEAIINGLDGIGVEVILIGTTTCGKPYGFYDTDNCGTTYFTVQFKGTNEQGFGDYADGFSPMNTIGAIGSLITGCSVEDDFIRSLGDPNESLIAAALNHRATGNCPTPTVSTKTSNSNSFKQNELENLNLELSNPNKLKDMILGLPE